ncbi:hypothetical protein D3C75_1287490 [compost metagenome]
MGSDAVRLFLAVERLQIVMLHHDMLDQLDCAEAAKVQCELHLLGQMPVERKDGNLAVFFLIYAD